MTQLVIIHNRGTLCFLPPEIFTPQGSGFLAKGHSDVLIELQTVASAWTRIRVTILTGIIEFDQKKDVGLLIPSGGRGIMCRTQVNGSGPSLFI